MNKFHSKHILKVYQWAYKNNIQTTKNRGIPRNKNVYIKWTKIYIDSNMLKKIPSSLFKINNLESLLVQKNKLKKLPKSIGKQKSLIKLYLNDNKLKKLPKSIINLTNLEKLWLHGNKKLVLTKKQKKWIKELKAKGCHISMPKDHSAYNYRYNKY